MPSGAPGEGTGPATVVIRRGVVARLNRGNELRSRLSWNENIGRLAGSRSNRFVNRVSVPVDS